MRAAGILLRARDTTRYLFLQEHDGVWVTPGGHLERGENPLQAAARELNEETGYDGSVFVEDRACELDGYVLFRGHVDEQFWVRLSNEHRDFVWARRNRWPKPLHPGLQELLQPASQ